MAGGSGTRFGSPKQFAMLSGRPVVQIAVQACRSVCHKVVLVVPAGCSDTSELHGADVAVEGGSTRSQSVRAGLQAVPMSAEIVVVHDAARPLAAPALFERLLTALEGEVAGATCAVSVSDTVKRVRADPSGRRMVVETLDRAELVAVQTPQAFKASALRRAHSTEPEATDDAALLESLCLEVSVVEGDPDNLKLTTKGDLALAEALVGG